MSGSETVKATLIAKIAALGAILMVAILASSAYLRLSVSSEPCLETDIACAVDAPVEAAPAPLGQRLARVAHRLSASTVAVLALLLAFGMWSSDARARWSGRLLAVALVALTVFLAILGAATRSTYSPAITLGNVLGGNLLAGMFCWVWLQAGRLRKPFVNRTSQPIWPVLLMLLALIQITSIAFGAGATLPVPLAMGYNLFGTLLLLGSLSWLSRCGSETR
jgi:heme A synthase